MLIILFFTPTCPGEIIDIINKIKPTKSKGQDEINMSFIKDIGSSVAEPISILINKSLELGMSQPIKNSKDHTSIQSQGAQFIY